MSRLTNAALALTFSLLGCDDGEESQAADGGSADGAVPDAAVVDSGDAQLDASLDDAATGTGSGGIREQTNVSFETAQRMDADGPPWLQDERSVDQVDYYVFSGRAGAFYEITTDRGNFTPDNMIELFDSEHHSIAQNDEGGMWGGDGLDARLVVRTPESGDYFVTVQDPWTPAAFFGTSFPLLYYHLNVRELTEDTPGIAIAHDSDEVSLAFATDMASGLSHVTLLAELGDDERTFNFDGKPDQVLVGHLQPSGAMGNGSSVEGGEVRVLDDEQHLLSRIDRALGQEAFHPPVQDASYRIALGPVESPDANAFHVIDVILLADNPVEQSEDDNGDMDAAEPLVLEGTIQRRGLVLLRLPEGDVDFFSIDARAHEYVSVLCEGESGGSGVRGLHAELLDGDGVLASAEETADENLSIESTLIDEAATLYLRIFTDGKTDATEIEPWARCAIETSP